MQRKRAWFCLVPWLAVVLAVGCNGSGGGPGTITISATLQSGTLERASLQNYKLYCLTFSNPPATATAIADANADVRMTIAGGGSPIVCFIYDPAGKEVAPLSFNYSSKAGPPVTPTVAFAGDVSLGNITVDLTNNVASAALPATATLINKPPGGLSCPVGNWKTAPFGSGNTACPAAQSVLSLSILADGKGGLVASVTGYQAFAAAGACVNRGFPVVDIQHLTGRDAFGVSLTIPQDAQAVGCSTAPNPVTTFTYTTNSTCTQMTGTAQTTGCYACDGANTLGFGCTGCGTTTCSNGAAPTLMSP